MNSRFIFSAAAMPSDQAKVMVYLSCKDAPPAHARMRKDLKRRFKRSLSRILNFAKHETIRKLTRYFHSNRPLSGQEHPGVSRIAFDPDELRQDFQSMLYAMMPDMLASTATNTVEDLGGRPFTMLSQDVLDFVGRRAELLSGLPDELFRRITDELSEGLSSGQSLGQLADRISQAFSDIDQGTAEVIADAETAAAFSYATDRAARSAGVQFKQWVHGGSRVPRPDHLAIDGLVVPIDQPYPVGSPPLMFPHAPDGSPEDVINCSCVSIPATADQYEG